MWSEDKAQPEPKPRGGISIKRAGFIYTAVALIVLLAIAVGLTQAQSPEPPSQKGVAAPLSASSTAFTYQGQLESEDEPVNGTCDMQFHLYDDVSAGAQVGSPTSLTVDIADGLFTVVLDFGPDIFTGASRWLDIAVQCPGDAGPVPLVPRQPLTAAPYAISLRPGAVISGTVADGSSLTVLNVHVLGTSYGVHSTGLIGIHGYGLDNGFGGGTGVEGACGGGSCFGVVGRGGMDGGAGVSGSGYYGVTGVGSSTGNVSRGVYGRSRSSTGTGVYGYADSSEGENYGVYGVSDSSEGYGVYGQSWRRGVHGRAVSLTGSTYGVYGEAISTLGAGVYGVAPGTGVHGHSSRTSGYGVGVYGETDSMTGWAGAFVTSVGHGVYISAPAGSAGLEVIGGSKNAVVATADNSRLLYTEEATEVWFADYGFGQLQDGVSVVEIDPIYAQTVNLDEPYHVFVQVYGQAEVYVSGRSPTHFEVHLLEGDAQVEFSYRIVALRLDFEGQRLERAPWADGDPNLYPEVAVDAP